MGRLIFLESWAFSNYDLDYCQSPMDTKDQLSTTTKTCSNGDQKTMSKFDH